MLVLAGIFGHANGDVRDIPVARTWGDLFAHPPLMVQADHVILAGSASTDPKKTAQVQVWVGIDRDRSATDGAVLLYCLSQGVAFSNTSDQDLGPFRVVVKRPINIQQASALMPRVSSVSDFQSSTFVLCTRSIPLGDAGSYEIDLVPRLKPPGDGSPGNAARVIVSVAGDPVLPWSPWSEPISPRALKANSFAEPTYVTAYVSNPLGGIAVPRAPSHPFYYARPPNNLTALPRLIPESADRTTQLSMAGGDFVLTATGIDWLVPRDNCLTRWWVNGKPVAPDPKGPMVKSCHGNGALPAGHPSAIHFQFNFHPERLGAVEGDMIGVQMLYMAEGYELCGGAQMDAQMALDTRDSADPPADFSTMSNRIDFVYSGDPENPRRP